MDSVPGRVDATARCWSTEAAVDDEGAVASSTLFLSATAVAPAPADGKQFAATVIVLPSGNLAVVCLLCATVFVSGTRTLFVTPLIVIVIG